MKQVIEWKEIEWDGYTNVNVPHMETCFFLNKEKWEECQKEELCN